MHLVHPSLLFFARALESKEPAWLYALRNTRLLLHRAPEVQAPTPRHTPYKPSLFLRREKISGQQQLLDYNRVGILVFSIPLLLQLSRPGQAEQKFKLRTLAQQRVPAARTAAFSSLSPRGQGFCFSEPTPRLPPMLRCGTIAFQLHIISYAHRNHDRICAGTIFGSTARSSS